MGSSPSQKIIRIAFERLESLWESWCESRYQNRLQVTNSILLNLKLIIEHGSEEDIVALLDYVHDFEPKLRMSIAERLRAEREKPIPQMLH